MESLTQIEIIKTLEKREISFFTLDDFQRLFKIDNRNSLYKIIQRLEKKGIIKKIIRGKYIFLLHPPNEFSLANWLYQPSYVSLESALSFYGVITGFSYQITSVSLKKAKLYNFDNGQSFQYNHIKTDLFWGFEKKEDFLIAKPEKALIDYLYLGFKGWRIIDKLPDELDLSVLDKSKLTAYIQKLTNLAFIKFLKGLKLC